MSARAGWSARAAERVARGVALLALAWLLVESFARPGAAPPPSVRADSLPGSLRRWSTTDSPRRVHVRVDGDVSPSASDWLAALSGTGTAVEWDGRGLVPVAAVVERVADPAGGAAIIAAAPNGTAIALADEFGPLDSTRARGGGARILAPSAPAAVRVRAGPLAARAAARDSLSLGRLLLLANAGWEGKFVLAALEERGWRVDARLALSPRGDVVQNPACGMAPCRALPPIDVEHFDAVVALDTSALTLAHQLIAYVRGGGGLVASARLLANPAMAPLRVGATGSSIPAVEPFASPLSDPRRDLALTPVALSTDAVSLEAREGAVAVAARRVDRGRVISTGYDDTWRWRMAGSENSEEAHRDWWAGLVARAAHVTAVPVTLDAPVDEAPLAHLIAKLGPPSSAPGRSGGAPHIPAGWLFAILLGAFIFEWSSRRLRGAP